MSLLGRLTGWDQNKEAHNAVLGSFVAERASAEMKKEIAGRLVLIQKQVRGGEAGDADTILRDLSRQPRIVQTNFIALACGSLGIPPGIGGLQFAAVDNPYRANNDSSKDRIGAVLRELSRRSGTQLSWPGNAAKINFTSWPSQSTASQPKSTSSSPQCDGEAVTFLAYNALLLQSIDRAEVRSVVDQILDSVSGSDYSFSEHDLATVVAMTFYKAFPDDLEPLQMLARMTALEWFENDELSEDALSVFENGLYQLYSS